MAKQTPENLKLMEQSLRRCSMCNIVKKYSEYHGDKKSWTKIKSNCIECCRRTRKKNEFRVKYGITLEIYQKMLESQDFSCAICKTKLEDRKDIRIDHDHNCCKGEFSCGKCIRGLLCNSCNCGLGYFKDNKILLKNAISYLN